LRHAVPDGDLAEILDRALTLPVEHLERRKTGKRFPEYHHVVPIQLRCRAHNRHEADLWFGPLIARERYDPCKQLTTNSVRTELWRNVHRLVDERVAAVHNAPCRRRSRCRATIAPYVRREWQLVQFFPGLAPGRIVSGPERHELVAVRGRDQVQHLVHYYVFEQVLRLLHQLGIHANMQMPIRFERRSTIAGIDQRLDDLGIYPVADVALALERDYVAEARAFRDSDRQAKSALLPYLSLMDLMNSMNRT
jgi:hypothetical protein